MCRRCGCPTARPPRCNAAAPSTSTPWSASTASTPATRPRSSPHPPGSGSSTSSTPSTSPPDRSRSPPRPTPTGPTGGPWRWGEQVDIRPLTLAGDGSITDQTAADHLAKAGYLAKYATKSTEATGHNSTRITGDTIGEHADPDGGHTARLIDACWRLGRPLHTPAPLTRRPPHDRPTRSAYDPFGEPWGCPDCGTHTRYRACPVCVAQRQASLDTKPANKPGAVNPYARLRRWAHMLGYGGHFLTKARRYSVTLRLLRDTRISFRRTAERDRAAVDPGTIRAVEHLDDPTTLIVGALTFAGVGWRTTGDALLANTAAAMARARHDVGREELAHEVGTALGYEALSQVA
jgi:hypothetical protein